MLLFNLIAAKTYSMPFTNLQPFPQLSDPQSLVINKPLLAELSTQIIMLYHFQRVLRVVLKMK